VSEDRQTPIQVVDALDEMFPWSSEWQAALDRSLLQSCARRKMWERHYKYMTYDEFLNVINRRMCDWIRQQGGGE
jgi:hypothetical protein